MTHNRPQTDATAHTTAADVPARIDGGRIFHAPTVEPQLIIDTVATNSETVPA